MVHTDTRYTHTVVQVQPVYMGGLPTYGCTGRHIYQDVPPGRHIARYIYPPREAILSVIALMFNVPSLGPEPRRMEVYDGLRVNVVVPSMLTFSSFCQESPVHGPWAGVWNLPVSLLADIPGQN